MCYLGTVSRVRCGSPFGKEPCSPCLVTGKTAAVHVRRQHHNMTSLLTSNQSRSRPDVGATAGCKVLRGPRPAAWDQETFPCIQAVAFLMLTGVQNIYRPCTPYISHSKQTCTFIHRPCTPSSRNTTKKFLPAHNNYAPPSHDPQPVPAHSVIPKCTFPSLAYRPLPPPGTFPHIVCTSCNWISCVLCKLL